MTDRFAADRLTELTPDPDQHVEPIFVRLPGVERMTNLKRTKILELAYAGDIPSVVVGRARLFPVAGIRAWAQRQIEAAGVAGDE